MIGRNPLEPRTIPEDCPSRTELWELGYAVLSNRQATEVPTMLEVPLDEVLTSSNLGNPTAMIREVFETCGGAI